MRSEEELLAELEWYEDWPDADDIDAPCETVFDSDGYVDGLRFALGRADGTREVPPPAAVNELIGRIETDYPDADVRVERHGWPPRPDVAIRVLDDIEAVDDHVVGRERLAELARGVESEYDGDWMIYTYYDRKRDSSDE